jgi:hypothetical protein
LFLLAGFLDVVPSLFVVLSYEQQRLTQQMNQVLPVTSANVPQRQRSKRLKHLSNSSQAADESQLALPNAGVNPPIEMASGIVPEKGSNATSSNEPGPTLKRRGAPGEAVARQPGQATIIPISGQSVSYSGGPTRGGALSSVMTAIDGVGSIGHGDKGGH